MQIRLCSLFRLFFNPTKKNTGLAYMDELQSELVVIKRLRPCLISCCILWVILTGLAMTERVYVEGPGRRYIMRGKTLELKCQFNGLAMNLNWFDPQQRHLTAEEGSVKITNSQIFPDNQSECKLEVLKITRDKEGVYTCKSDNASFDVNAIVIDVLKTQSAIGTTSYNLTCSLVGSKLNASEIQAYWELPNGDRIYESTSKLKMGLSKWKDFMWLIVDAQYNPGKFNCAFELKENNVTAKEFFEIKHEGISRNTLHVTITVTSTSKFSYDYYLPGQNKSK